MRHAFKFKINFTGGIISPGYLHNILEALEVAGIDNVRFGLRQQLLIDVSHKEYEKVVASLNLHKIQYENKTDSYPNILSSYPAEEIFIRDSWVKEGVYKDIFDLFDYRPAIKINIADNNQTFTPFFTGNINWIASKNIHFWYLYIRFPKTNIIYQWKDLIYTNEIPRLSKFIEKIIFENPELYYDNNLAYGDIIYEQVHSSISIISKPVEENLFLPEFKLPYYEGFNNYGTKSWLGLYQRNELFKVSFLKDICKLCLETKIGQLYTTPWKSLIIKNIDEKHRHLWSFILNRHRINVRHASNELNWQVEDTNEEGLSIKQHIIRQLDKDDVRTYGLCIAVKTQPKSGVFGSIIIKKQYNVIRDTLKPSSKFDILYSSGFNPNSNELIVFRNNVSKEHLATYLISLCKYYYENFCKNDLLKETAIKEEYFESNLSIPTMVYQCRKCLTVYDEEIGEPENKIAPGTLFNQLDSAYKCTVCDATKENFVLVSKTSLGLQAI